MAGDGDMPRSTVRGGGAAMNRRRIRGTVNNHSFITFHSQLLITMQSKSSCSNFLSLVLQGLCLETILWCTSFKYVHATCIVAFTSVFIMGKNKCSSPCSMF